MGSFSSMSLQDTALLLTLLLFYSCTALDTLIQLPTGQLQGRIQQSRDGKEFASFEGVPYAEEPERWLPPELKTSWDGTLDCSKAGPMCLQTDPSTPDTTVGSEDCLSMNIYTTSTDKEANMPVIVFLHGGGMILGTGEYYEGHFLVDHGVISITMNYRLDILGFFSLDTPKISGNQALRDIQLGLRWVRENIRFFGGDPDRVVISGQSGGSWATSMIYASPLSDSLISGAIFQSGVVVGPLGYPVDTREEALYKSKLLAQELGCYSEEDDWDPENIEQCLADKSSEEILLAGFQTHVSWATSGLIDTFSEHGAVLPVPLEDILQQGLLQQVPLMVGTMSNEMLLFAPEELADPSMMDMYNDNKVWTSNALYQMLPQKDLLNLTDSCDEMHALQAKDFYFGETTDSDDLLAYLAFGSDVKFGFGTNKWIDYMSSSGNLGPVYNYIMSFQDNTSFSFAPGVVGRGLGVAHGDELPYLYKIDPNYYDVPYSGWSEDNQQHSSRMCELWANFAKYGNPTPVPGSQALGNVTWEEYDIGKPSYMDLGLELKMVSDPELMKRLTFWKDTLANDCSDTLGENIKLAGPLPCYQTRK